jgi:diguanylate cyclase (GGDEF)-like protein
MFRRIRTRLAVLYAGLFAVALALVSIALYVVLATTAERQVRGELVASATVFDRLWTMRSRELGNAAGVLARDFGFREAVATGDPGTVESALDNLKARLGLRTAFIVNYDGSVTGTRDPRLRREAARLWTPLDAGETSGVAALDGVPHHIVAAPILSPTLTGWVVFATPLGPSEMQSLERLSAIPIEASVVQGGRGRGWGDGAVDAFVRSHLGDNEPAELKDGAGVSVALAKPLHSLDPGRPAALLLRYPVALAMAPYRPLQAAMALTGLAGLILLLFGSWRLSLSITRPISLLDRAARRMEAGETVEVTVETADEIGRLARSFNAMAAGIAERERRITELAFTDSLTGLPNRAFFRQHLALELRQRSAAPLVLFCLDLDSFHAVNDALGHAVGDALLRAAAERLRAGADGAFVARLGADGFAVVARGGADPALRARRLASLFAQPFELDGRSLSVSASLGVAVAEEGDDPDGLLNEAELALAQAKQEGRGAIGFFESEMNARAQARHRLEEDLAQALGRGEFELFFQPLVELEGGVIAGFEALLRWNHPERGRIGPAEFVPVAEETGVIVPVGAWVVEEACRRAAGWPGEVRVAVNVSSVQLRKSGFQAVVVRALAASGLDPHRLELEITESLFLESSEEILQTLHALRTLGVRVALDDFGTGYSSLAYLQSFPFDKIKIDRAFVEPLGRRHGARAIVAAIATLARSLGMETTAEGVEEEAQLEALRALGCTSVQGFLFSRPVDAAAAAALLATGVRAAA